MELRRLCTEPLIYCHAFAYSSGALHEAQQPPIIYFVRNFNFLVLKSPFLKIESSEMPEVVTSETQNREIHFPITEPAIPSMLR